LRAFQERDQGLSWRARGLCRSVDPEVFFPAPSEPADVAVALCRTCDVQGACLAWALEVGDCHGVWGATTPRERRAMLVAWRGDGFDATLAAAGLGAAVGPATLPGGPGSLPTQVSLRNVFAEAAALRPTSHAAHAAHASHASRELATSA
jgi:hypothetical protein